MQSQVHNKYSYTSTIYNGVKFLLKYSPSYQEIIFRITIKASFETIFAPFVEFLTENGNPTVTSIIRDGLMLPEVFMHAYNKQEIGTTGITYDGFAIGGTLSRGGCRAALLYNAESLESVYNTTIAQFGYSNSLNITEHALAGRVGSYVCEYGSLAANVLSREKQLKLNDLVLKAVKAAFGDRHRIFKEGDEYKAELSKVTKIFKESIQHNGIDGINKIKEEYKQTVLNKLVPALDEPNKFEHQGYFTYARENFKLFDTVKAVVPGAIVRSIISDQMGEVIRWGKKLDIVTTPYYYIDGKKNELISYAFNITKLDSNDNLGVQREKIYQEAESNTAFVVDTILLASGAVYRIGREIVEANIMIPPVKAGYDLVVYYGMQDHPFQTAAAVSAAFCLYSSKDKIASYVNSQIEYFYPVDEFQPQECVGENCPMVVDEL
jgi:hypothetical protein